MVRIVIFEYEILFRDGLKYLLETVPDFRVVGEGRTSEELFALLAHTPADMTIVGVNPPDEFNCAEMVERLQSEYPAMKILVMANPVASKFLLSMMAGINGFIEKQKVDKNNLEKIIREVAEGESFIGYFDSDELSIDNSTLQRAFREYLSSEERKTEIECAFIRNAIPITWKS